MAGDDSIDLRPGQLLPISGSHFPQVPTDETSLLRFDHGTGRMKPGTRIRMNSRCVWSGRIGCEGVVVDPATFKGVYPADKPLRGRSIVLLDDDPLEVYASYEGKQRGWTCVIDNRSLEVVSTPSQGRDADA